MHRTAYCPWCHKDSWQSEWEAMYTTVRCMWCRCEFQGDNIVKDGAAEKKYREVE